MKMANQGGKWEVDIQRVIGIAPFKRLKILCDVDKGKKKKGYSFWHFLRFFFFCCLMCKNGGEREKVEWPVGPFLTSLVRMVRNTKRFK